MEFDERLQNAMSFIKHFVYKMKDGAKKPTTKMIELHDRLLSSRTTSETFESCMITCN